MDIRFIPVLDLDYSHTSVPSLRHSISAEYEQQYRQDIFRACGFPDHFKSIQADCSFYAIQEISDANLTKILKDTVFKNTSLTGGYALMNAQQQLLLLPRCCSDLNDITAWSHLAEGNIRQFWIGHPQVLCECVDEMVSFKPDASQDHTGFEVPLKTLRLAVDRLKEELGHIQQRFAQLAQTERLKVDKVMKLMPRLQ